MTVLVAGALPDQAPLWYLINWDADTLFLCKVIGCSTGVQ